MTKISLSSVGSMTLRIRDAGVLVEAALVMIRQEAGVAKTKFRSSSSLVKLY